MQSLYTDRKRIRSVTLANPSIDNCLCSTSKKRFEYVSKSFWIRVNKGNFENVLKRSLQDVLRTPWGSLQNVLKMSWRRIENILARRLEDVLKMLWRHLLKTSSEYKDERRLQDVFKTSSSGRMFAELFKKNFYWKNVFQLFPETHWVNNFSLKLL